MKTRLLFAFAGMMLLGTLSAQTQQMFAITSLGGDSSEGSIIRFNPDGSGFSVAYSYSCSHTSGCHPKGNLMQASDGNLYGTCYDGGIYGSCTIDRYNPVTGAYTDVYDFDITNGDYPMSGLVEAPNGKLYGVASYGGFGDGVLYSFDLASHIYVPKYSFGFLNGSRPYAPPILKNNVLYGATTLGGTHNGGVLYKFNIANSSYTVIFNFDSASGVNPKGSFFEASNGLMYGMTSTGGLNNKGVIFSFDYVTSNYYPLHSFDGLNGAYPYGSFMQAADGKLYAVTESGGENDAGVLFSFDPSSNEFVKLFDFISSIGSSPMGNLFQTPDGKLYGTAKLGGSGNMGVSFSYDVASNIYTVIQEFNGANGAQPEGGFIMVNLSTSVTPITPQLFSVYPNPATDEINLTFDKKSAYSIQIRNVFGEIVFVTERNSLETRIDMSHLCKGIYFVEVIGDNKNILTKKIVKI